MYTRRELGKLALSASAAAITARSAVAAAGQRSTVAGVKIGMNVPYNFKNTATTTEDILDRSVKLGLSAVELRARPIEASLGLPLHLQPRPGLVGGGLGRGAGAAPPPPTAAEQQAAKARLAELRRWRLAAPMDRARAIRRMYEDAGVMIEIVKFDDVPTYSLEEFEYAFTLARTLGARAISCEYSADEAKRIAPFAEKARMLVGFHGHAEVSPALYGQLFTYGKYIGANVDIGHFVAGQNISPVPLIKQHHDRITHLHIKDRKLHEGPNMPFGQGDTPIKEVLQLVRDNKWNIQATIEFEYPVPAGSDVMTELAKTLQYCREALQA